MPTKTKISDNEFKQLFDKHGVDKLSEILELNRRSVQRRRRNIEVKHHVALGSPNVEQIKFPVKRISEYPGWVGLDVKDGIVLVGSDAHIWPGKPSTAMRAFIKFAKDLKPKAVILNGDGMDFPRISRHPPIGWKYTPTVVEELEAAQEQIGQLELAAGRARKIWSLGNHDARFETNLASHAPEYAKVNGTSLQDHFPLWEPCWAAQVNDDVVIKHRFKGGIHATHNNVLWSGKSVVTGHLHSLQVRPFTDYNGTRWGVDTGCLADVHARAFLDYTEANPLNWRSGFIVLTFRKGELLWPEIVSVHDDNHVQFRGEIIRV